MNADTSAPTAPDAARIETLRRTGLLDSPREQSFDRLTRLAAIALRAPMALVSVIDDKRHFIKSSVGLPEPWASARECPMSHSFCRHVVAMAQPLVVTDARSHDQVRDNPAIVDMGVIAYAGVPLRTTEGHVIGAFAIADHQVHEWTPEDVALLADLGAATMHEIEVRGALRTATWQTAQAVADAQAHQCVLPQFRTILERSPVGVCAVQDGLFQFTNPALADMLGYTEEELLAGASLLDLVAEGERSWVTEQLGSGLRGDVRSVCCEFDALRKDGGILHVELRATPATIADRPALIASVIDITTRTASETMLRRREAQLRALSDNAWDVVHTLAPDGTIQYMSPSIERVLGYPPAEMIGRHARDFVHPDDVTLADESFSENIDHAGARKRLDLRLHHRNGSWREVEVVGQVLTDPSGVPMAIVHTHDVTEQKQMERELRRESATVELLELVAVASNEAVSVPSALAPCLTHVCVHNDWCAAHAYLRDAAGNLASTGDWYLVDPERLGAFRDATDKMVFSPTDGLPGMVLTTGKAAWIPDVLTDPAFTRREEARAAGVRGGIACPLLVGSEVVGVVEFFATRVVELDRPLMEVLAHVGTQLGRVVERVQTQEALRHSEARVRSIVEMSHDAFVATDADGTITEWNGQAEATFGFTRGDALGKAMPDLIIPARLRSNHRRALRHFLKTGKYRLHSRRFETEALHQDGHEFPVELSITAIPLDDSYMFTAFLHDITERRSSEERIRQSEERYDLVARATSDVVWDWNITSGVLTWNTAIQRTCRYSADQVGTTMEWWYNHIHPGDRERVVTSTHAVLNGTADAWADEYRFQRGDGTYATVLARGHVVRNSHSEATRMIGSMVDISERKIEEEAQRFIAQATALLDTSLEQKVILTSLARLALPTLGEFCVIDVLDDTGAVRRAAGAHVDPSREILLRAVEERALAGELTGGERDLVAEVIRTRQPLLVRECSPAALKSLGINERLRATLLELSAISLMIVPLLTREQVLGAISFGVSEPGRSYDLRDLLTAEQLSQRAARTIDNGRLYDKAQRAISARDEVLAVVSHDLRNPLSTISLSASMLLDQQEDRRAGSGRFIEIIQRAAEQANRLIRDLLDISSVEAGHFSVNRSRENVAELLEQAREMLAPIAEEKSIHLTCDVKDAALVASADVGQIQRVFSNLVGNAIKFTPTGGSITLRAEAVDDNLQFAISDTGPGIPPEQLPHVFDRFWQANRGDRRGAGLGLSIVRGIVEAHGGRIWVESRLGEGTTFYFTVPLQRASA